jgi:hypothetical protein
MVQNNNIDMLNLQQLAFRRARQVPLTRGFFRGQDKGVEDKSEKRPLLEENKTFLQRLRHFFTYTFRYAFLSPLQRGFKDLFRSKPQESPWYSSFWGAS